MLYCNVLYRSEEFEKIKGIAFDCDGVMFDSKRANVFYYNSIREKVGLGPMSAEEEDFVHSRSVAQSLNKIIPPHLREEADNKRREMGYAHVLPHMLMEPGLVPLLHLMRDYGYPLAVNTNRTDTMDMVLERFDLRRFFSPVITAGKLSRTKPHPESMIRILDMWRMKPEEVVYIGDSKVDERTARSAGVHFWAYKNPALMCDMYIQDFWSLRSFLIHNAPRWRSERRCF